MIDPNKLSVNSAPTGALVLPAGLLNQITCVGFRNNSGDFVPDRRNTAGLLSTVVMGGADFVPLSQKRGSGCARVRKCDVCPNSKANKVGKS